MATYAWPSNLIPAQVFFDPRGMSIAGYPTLSGRIQTVSGDAGYWIAGYKTTWAFDPDKVRAFRSIRALLYGSSLPVLVPTFDYAQIPYVLDGNGQAIQTVADATFDDTATFSDGSGFYSPPIYVECVNNQNIGDTQIVLNFKSSGAVTSGHLFSIGERLYVISAIGPASGNQYTCQIWPRLREAVAAGAYVNFATPACRMRLLSDSDADLLLDRGRFGNPDINFIEVI